MRKILDDVKRHTDFSDRTKEFIRQNIDDLFLSPIEKHYCSTTGSGVKVCHLDPGSCWMKKNLISGITCADTLESPQVIKAGEDNSIFTDHSEQFSFASCLVRVGPKLTIMYRHFDENGHGMTQWDRLVPLDIWAELVPSAKALGVYFEVPFAFAARTEEAKKA